MLLLAPAKNIEIAKAAIQAGADAVYIGASAFGARQAAGNSIEDIASLVQYAKPFGVQVMVTLNTLLKEDEISEAVRLAWQVYEAGADAILIQDLRLLKEKLPPIRLHASTQCDNRSAEQVLRLQRLGFKLAVLARELTIDEIRAIRAATLRAAEEDGTEPIELEVFVHGALCVSYSGRCYMSEVLMNRSANRGECAQMCRMAYDLLDKDGNEIKDDRGKPVHQRYVLSLEDMDRSAYLKELLDAGVSIIKIEGRLKSADYVTNIVAYYRQKLDRVLGRQTEVSYSFTPNPEKTFHRGGIDYFLHGRTRPMANWTTPKSTGEFIGRYIGRAGGRLRVELEKGITLHAGDGIGYGNEGFSVNKVESGLITPNRLPDSLLPGTMLYRNYDKVFTDNLHAERRVAIDIELKETEEGFELRIGDKKGHFVYPHEAARDVEKTFSTQRAQLAKLGDTIYKARVIRLPEKAYFIPISVLNAWRREVMGLNTASPC